MPERQLDPSRIGTGNQAIRSIEQRLALFIGLLLSVCTLALFWPVIHHDFVNYDDSLYVTDNLVVQQGLTAEGAGWALQTSHASNWHPLTWLSHMLDCSVFGLFPGGHHLTSLLLHMANTVLLFLLLRRMTGALWRSGLVAALFSWHPLHVESVAWVAERKDLLSTLFWILTIWAYVRYVEWRSGTASTPHAPGSTLHAPRWYCLALLCFALGLMAKPMVVTLPFVLLLLDYWPLNRLQGREEAEAPTEPNRDCWRKRCWLLLREKIPFFALSATCCLVTVWAQHRGGAIRSFDALPMSFRLANALTGYGAYLWKMIWPADLAVFYPLPSQAPLWGAVCATLALLGISTIAFAFKRRRPVILVGWLWYLGTLVPVIGFVQVGVQAMADRYTYIPLIGIFMSLVWSLEEWSSAWRLPRPAKIAFAGLLLAVCASVTGNQLQYWSDGVTLFGQAVRVTRNNPVTHAAYGVALSAQSRSAEAIAQFSEALRLNPNYALAHVSLAGELADQGRDEEAIAHLKEVLRQKPGEAGAHNNLGALLAKNGQLENAIDHFRTAIQLQADYLKAHLNLALALAKQGKTAEALQCYRDAMQKDPYSPEPPDKLAWIMATHQNPQFRDGSEAVRLARRASHLSHRSQPSYLDTLAAAFAEAGRFNEAVATGQEAFQLAASLGQRDLSLQIQRRLDDYKEGKPFREAE